MSVRHNDTKANFPRNRWFDESCKQMKEDG